MFDNSFKRVIETEGGYVDNPRDRGGPTKYGITITTLCSWRKRAVTKDDVKGITLEEAKNIYKRYYWDTLSLDHVKSELIQDIMFDQAVNSGIVTIAKLVQTLVKAKPDGVIGPVTLAAINAATAMGAGGLAFDIIKERQLFYVKLCKKDPTQLEFLEGWINRTHKLLAWLV